MVVIAQGEVYALIDRNQVRIGVAEYVETAVAHIRKFELGVAVDFSLERQIPLPGVGKDIAWILTEARRS